MYLWYCYEKAPPLPLLHYERAEASHASILRRPCAYLFTRCRLQCVTVMNINYQRSRMTEQFIITRIRQRVKTRPVDTGHEGRAIGGQYSLNCSCATILLFPEFFLLKHTIKRKSCLTKNAFCPPKLKSWLRAYLKQGSRAQWFVSAVHNCKNTRLCGMPRRIAFIQKVCKGDDGNSGLTVWNL